MPCDNKGRSAATVASRPERGSSTPEGVTSALWLLGTKGSHLRVHRSVAPLPLDAAV